MNEIPHPGFDKPEEYETFTTTNDLEEAAVEFADKEYMVGDVDRSALYKGFWHGAKWQAKRILEHVKLAYGKVSMNPFDCSEAFEELINKINAL